ncbi:hypothetical protein HDU92_008326 [Lobulomyces angularis]|nr:hypothetical protein HDU92_008326 [Lobulomyces angularis]
MSDTFLLNNIENLPHYKKNGLFGEQKHPDFDVVIDVGAYDGSDYTIPGYNLGYTVFSFELNPANHQLCYNKFAAAGFKEGVDFTTIGQVPKFDSSKRPHIYFIKAGVSNRNAGIKVSGVDVYGQVDTKAKGDSPIVKIDDFISDESVYVFKADTQGHEYGVFSGGLKVLNGVIKFVSLEYWPQGHRENGFNSIDTLNLMFDAGFKCMDYKREYMPITRPSEIHEFTEFIDAIPRSTDALGGWVDVLCEH